MGFIRSVTKNNPQVSTKTATTAQDTSDVATQTYQSELPPIVDVPLINDIEEAMRSISRSLPMVDEEVLYKNECNSQERIFLFYSIIGGLMIILMILI